MSRTIAAKPIADIDDVPCDTDDPGLMPREHLEARICELSGHITAATARYLDLVADFDERECWADWEMRSCAEWLAWKCQLAPGTAREQVRVARALRDLPFIHDEFAAARLSYSKVRALTRIATPDNEKDLAEITLMMTAGQTERFARAYATASGDGTGSGKPALRKKLTWNQDSSGTRISLHLPPSEAAVVLQALRAMVGDLDHSHDAPGPGHDRADGDPSAPKPPAERLKERDEKAGLDWDTDAKPREKNIVPAEDLADAMVTICGDYLAGKITAADNPDIYQVIIHAGTGAITDAPRPGTETETETETEETPRDVSAETPDAIAENVSAETPAKTGKLAPSQQAMDILKETVPLLTFPETHPASPWRSHVEDAGYVDAATLQMIACDATISTMLHDGAGDVLNVGRRTRKPPARLRRAVRERDRYRCRFPGCESRRVDLHHVQFWANGGETSLENCCSLCKTHHGLVHTGRVMITRTSGGGFSFHLADGTPIPSAPPSPGGSTDAIPGCHDAQVEYHTIVPPHSGERLDLHEAIWVCLSSQLMREARRQEEAERHLQERKQEQEVTLAA